MPPRDPPSSRRARSRWSWAHLLLLLPTSAAQVTVYTARPDTSPATATRAPNATWTGLPMYDPLQLVPPAPPSPPVTSLAVAIPPTTAALAEAGRHVSIAQKGNFLGFSIELSVADAVMGASGRHLKPEFLNYLANIYARAGSGPVVRVGGNTQDNSTIMPDGFPGGGMIEKIREVGVGPTETPWINYSPLLLYTMANISTLVHTEWYFGLAFNYTDATLDWHNIPIAADYAQRILGRYLKGLPLGNEPDLYTDHGKRPADWTINNYVDEWTRVSQNVLDNAQLPMNNIFLGPSTCCDRVGFELPDIAQAGWLSTNIDKLGQLSLQHYPNNNCQLNDRIINPQDIFAGYLNHTGVVALTSQYSDEISISQGAGKEIVMLEMNTASCGGFPGLSTSFGAALWMVDWSLQMAHWNFSQALMHVGGQNVYYNPFTPPPGNMTGIYQWTTGSVYYSTLVVAEIFGQSNASHIIDLDLGDLHPGYAVYENDVPSRVALFNYVSDPSGASTYQATLAVPSSIAQVHVRYLVAPSAAEHDNITWAGQTMRGSYLSDGRLHGDVDTRTVQCSGGNCVVAVPAPAIAVVYLSDDALRLSSPPQGTAAGAGAQGVAAAGFETTVVGWGDATVDPRVMETSNGQNGPEGWSGRNNRATSGAAAAAGVMASGERAMMSVGVAIVVGVVGMVLVKLERQL